MFSDPKLYNLPNSFFLFLSCNAAAEDTLDCFLFLCAVSSSSTSAISFGYQMNKLVVTQDIACQLYLVEK